MTQKPITVLIVDDSALIRQMYTEILSSEPDIEVVGTAADPLSAREKIKQLNPDVLTLDIEMPHMDGLSFLEKIMTLRPMPVVMASSLTQKGADATIRALEIGAFDYVSKPVSHQTRDTIGDMKEDLVAKVRAAAQSRPADRAGRAAFSPRGAQVVAYTPPAHGPLPIIAIGSSTGGVEALREIFLRLPANIPPIVMTQHMPEHFTRSFAARLDSLSQVTVCEAANHMRLKQGHAYLAPGHSHLRLVRVGSELVCRLDDGPLVSGHRPSVDVLFHSVAESVGRNAIGVILTGMGKDGAQGLKAMRDRGSFNLGQDQASCVVYGMPRVAAQLGATQVELPLHDLAAAIVKQAEKIGKAA